MTDASSLYVVVVEIDVIPDGMTTFLPLMERNALQSLAIEAGCTQFDVCRPNDKTDAVLLYEVYVNRAAFEAHLQSPHFLDFDKASASMVVAKKVRTFKRLVPLG